MWRVVQSEWKFFLILLLLLSVLGVCYYEYKQYQAKGQSITQLPQPNITINTAGEQAKPGEPQVVYVQGHNTQTKEIVYVPKEVDVNSGNLEKTDVQFEKKQGKIYVKINGKDFAVPADVQESAKFDKGKLVVSEQSELKIHITAPQPAYQLGVGWSKHGPAGQLSGPLFKNVAWWVYGDKQTVAGGLQFPLLK